MIYREDHEDRKISSQIDAEKSTKYLIVITGHFINLQTTWYQLRSIYKLDNKEKRDLVHNRFVGIFLILQSAMLSDVCLKICRLIDPPSQQGSENITLKYFMDVEDLKLKTLIQTALSSCEHVKGLRNKIIAHNDDKQVTDHGNHCYTSFSQVRISEIDRAVSSLRFAINALSRKYKGFEIPALNPHSLPGGDMNRLLDLVQKGLESEAQEQMSVQRRV